MISIRRAVKSDVDSIIQLFEDTVRHINQKDYSRDQLAVWANAKYLAILADNVLTQYFFVAEIQEHLVGFSSFTQDGYLDFMYVHKDFQSQGIATSLLEHILKEASDMNIKRLYASVSITAQPFFRSKGFQTYDEEHKVIKGISFTNALMEKEI